jgi:hypothetical protein
MAYERWREPLLSREQFLRRMMRHGGAALLVLIVSLGLGVLGYRLFAGLGWVESLLNASMILAGMGPVDTLPTTAAKVFASCYAIFSGVAFLGLVGLLFVPLFHRFLHRFHLEGAGAGPSSEEGDS